MAPGGAPSTISSGPKPRYVHFTILRPRYVHFTRFPRGKDDRCCPGNCRNCRFRALRVHGLQGLDEGYHFVIDAVPGFAAIAAFEHFGPFESMAFKAWTKDIIFFDLEDITESRIIQHDFLEASMFKLMLINPVCSASPLARAQWRTPIHSFQESCFLASHPGL